MESSRLICFFFGGSLPIQFQLQYQAYVIKKYLVIKIFIQSLMLILIFILIQFQHGHLVGLLTNDQQIKVDLTKQMKESIEKLMEPKSTYRETGYRYVNLIVYLLAALVNSLPAQTFSSINSLVETRYKYSPIVVTLNTLVFPILHPVCAYPANWILDKFGMKIGCSIGGALLVCGVWARTFLEVGQPGWCLAGSILASIGNVFILNSPSILANNWFKPQSIPSVISIAVLANLISITLGAAAPGLILKNDSDKEEIQRFLRNEAVVVTIPIIFLFLALRSRPKIPPSKSAESQANNKEDYIQTVKKLFKNKEYLKVMASMAFSYGTVISYLAVMDQCLKHLNYKEPGKATALIIMSAMIAGIFSTFLFVKRIKETLQYRKIICICLGFAFIMFVLLQLFLIQVVEEWYLLVIIGLCAGVFLIPFTALFMAYSSEIVFPLGEGSATGYLFATSQTFGAFLGLASISLIDSAGNTKTKVFAVMGAHSIFFILALLATLSTKQTLNRTKYQQSKMEQQESDVIVSNT